MDSNRRFRRRTFGRQSGLLQEGPPRPDPNKTTNPTRCRRALRGPTRVQRCPTTPYPPHRPAERPPTKGGVERSAGRAASYKRRGRTIGRRSGLLQEGPPRPDPHITTNPTRCRRALRGPTRTKPPTQPAVGGPSAARPAFNDAPQPRTRPIGRRSGLLQKAGSNDRPAERPPTGGPSAARPAHNHQPNPL
jgi:hypothetical protein